MALKIHTSNRMELLLDSLAEVVRSPLESPFAPETIVVQSKGMQRWLSMELASRFGVWANCVYPFPNKIVQTLFAALIPDYPEDTRRFGQEVLAWRVMSLLREKGAAPGFEEVGSYVADDPGGLKALQLARRIADTFDKYTVYRPDLLKAWENGERNDGWQTLMWRELTRDRSDRHLGALFLEFCAGAADPADFSRRVAEALAVPLRLMRKGEVPFPRRIALIGIPALPPFHLKVLWEVAQHLDVHLFLLNPCRQYWGKIVTEKERLRREEEGADEWYETGNPLLASLGKLGRDFFETVIEGFGCDDPEEAFAAPPTECALHRLQTEILELAEPSAPEGDAGLPLGDESILVHSCHSPMREIEVLYDALLALFEKNRDLTPRDVIVMTPDIEAYAPYISAVFETPPQGGERIPYSIADRNLINEGEAARALLAVLRLCGGRFGAAEVMDVLEAPPVARRFSLASADLETVRDWLRRTNIRWGIDADQRGRHGLPPFKENSWEAGLDRLLLGYAANGAGRRFFRDILPFDDMEGGDALVLGRFLEFCETLFSFCRKLEAPRRVTGWAQELREGIAALLESDEDGERELVSLRELLDDLEKDLAAAAFDGEIGIEAIRYWLQERLGEAERGFGFLTGGVTFCAMLPMRSIPFPVVCLIGMNDGAFPRRNRPSGFDLIAAEPRRGDRSLRDEDRYLFLEALLSARQRLHISYVGQSIRDNSEIPPSVLVSELLDYLARGYGEKQAETLFWVRHPLQPFSPAYFSGDSRLYSYSQHNFAGAKAKLAPVAALPRFISSPLPRVGEDEFVTLKSLVDFLCHPSRELLKRRLGMKVEHAVEPLEECEPLALPQLVKYQLEQEIVAAQVKREDVEEVFAIARGRGDLPPGEYGRTLFDGLAVKAAEFAQQVLDACQGEPLPPLDLELHFDTATVIGRIGSLRCDRLLHYRYTKLKAKDLLRIWVEHLALNCLDEAGYPKESVVIASDALVALPPIPQAREILERILALYHRGMEFPVRFFPETSYEYAKKHLDPKKSHKALTDARGKWYGSEFYPGESGDVHNHGVFGDEEPLDEEFMATALAIWSPLLAHQSKGGKRTK
ncbi:exodeoxyribonuclease V subunit gamma [Geomesophilobacter sediminis]|uniref:Exodeoxyribonuclease V subunit gamma n=1 Tax=Geomesophilobacter sediminis TaxID=2798584 RepID=A0A8J7M1M0_9BACT|nr:exodeoxyribonuclease V subunit gamma [Geomesophilobacter sediminis]MBJ6726972.1 exodeoxyribonuclease V subunit gamma [Geomesophilobacter sediminis]